MFLEKTLERNEELIRVAFELNEKGIIEPDTYVIDLDATIENARHIKEAADKNNVKLYFMTKQFGRNPIICNEFMKLGYEGAVVVDFKEAEVMIENNIKIGHVGHLVQIPKNLVKKVVASNPDYITVYSIEKAEEIDRVAKELGVVQKVMIRVLDKGDNLYSGQYGGFYIDNIEEAINKLIKLENIKIDGITSFPCFLYNESSNEIEATNNVDTIKKVDKILKDRFNIKVSQLNMPSATCEHTAKKINENGGTHGEPGHGLTGTTPYHKDNMAAEIPSLVYVSEISHNLESKSYCYGGGHYRRSHMENALVGKSLENSKKIKVVAPTDESIDYHFEITENCNVGDTVVMAFRTQIFVTRSNVAVVKGIKSGKIEVLGIYNALGTKVK